MTRSVVLLLFGAVAGGAVVTWLTDRAAGPAGAGVVPAAFESSARAAPAEEVAPIGRPAPSATRPPAGRVAERVTVYENALAATDVIDLETMIGLAVTQPPSVSRDREIEALIVRFAEMNPLRAVRFAQSVFLEPRFVDQAFRALARADVDLAIAELARLASPASKRNASLALLEVIGFDQGAVERVALALPASERVGFRHDAIIARALFDPAGSLEAALNLDGASLQRLVLSRVARIAAGRDPRAMLALAERIGDAGLRTRFTIETLTAWAELEPQAVFTHLETSASADLATGIGVFDALARHDPERLLRAAEGFPANTRRSAQAAYLQVLGETDPLAAFARIDLLPPGQDRVAVMASIGTAYGSRNPDAALEWVRSLAEPNQDVLMSVLRGIAQVDFDRAIDEVLNESGSAGSGTGGMPMMSSLTFLMLGVGPAGDADFERIADRLLVRTDEATTRPMFSLVMSRWSNDDQQGALRWALANADRLDASSFASLASQAVLEDPDLAIRTLSRLPVGAREGWAQGVAQGLAQSDLDRAIRFVDGQRGQPGFEDVLVTVASRAARTDPVRAARLVESGGASPRVLSAASMVAAQWAAQDPGAAAEWAIGLANERAQAQSIQNVTRTWALTDPGAAERWTLGLPSSTVRDSALDGYVTVAAQAGTFEPRLLDSYSSESARQQGARNAIVQIGRNDVGEARRLVEVYITDAAIREQIEQQLAQSGGVGDGRLITPGGGVVIFN